MRFFATSHETPKATPELLSSTMSEEIALGKQLYAAGVIVEAYMDPGYTATFMIVEAASIEAVTSAFAAYPQVRERLIEFTITPLIGLPAIEMLHTENGTPLPAWWPDTSHA